MIVNNANLQALRTGFSAAFQKGLGLVANHRDKVATVIKSTTAENAYGWLLQMSEMREWIGPRQVESVAEGGYVIRNRHFEKTIGVQKTDIEDDNLGQYSLLFSNLGEAAQGTPESLVWGAIKNGFTTKCADGQNFFDTDHPYTAADGTKKVQSNTGGGDGAPWFLMCTNRSVKPVVIQERTPIQFASLTKPDDPHVFMNKEHLYGAEWRGNVGYTFPQLAYGSKQDLTAATYAAAFKAIEEMKGDGGRPLNLTPNLLVVSPANREAAQEILNAERNASGATNPWRGTAELLVVPLLA